MRIIKKLFIFTIILSVLLLSTASLVEAKGGSGRGSEFRVDDEIENEIEDEMEQRVRIREDDRFDIRGTVNSISGNTVVIAGQTIVLDRNQVMRLRQRGTLATGQAARAKGVVQNGTLFAEEVRTINLGAN
ncbi:MAG: hypothetical protein A2782_01535 [Candidatus Blackburnbacteria bacterium RIFCSPHIGHO2_01_FULL_43_15b]|uniref:DUF5666 domain-containing protein n=1 Tax=Candidatus Blackburnbacteria bacterium RIFCSPHIGHO2_01_FULL_43_15b TaxID=1797513 RepID=A0A1G1UXH5_9BACT|nr:MAG: hypothetical protein A2782_01535 [Candidatus Blackburnbacteria bacterium RIFCSPHIGHO2_01_FULL_43_15b]